MVSDIKQDKNSMENVEKVMKSYFEAPEVFVGTNNKVNKNMVDLLSKIYLVAKRNENIESDSLDELSVQGFDNEQIWSQIQLHNDPNLNSISKKIKSYLESVNNISILNDSSSSSSKGKKSQLEDDEDLDMDDEEMNLDDEDDINFDDQMDSEDMDGEDMDGEDMDDEDMDDEDMDEEDMKDEDDEEEEEKPKAKKMNTNNKSDINFFNQREMEKFLDDADEEGYNFNQDNQDGEDIDELELGNSEDEDGLTFPVADSEDEDEIDKLLEDKLDRMKDEYGKEVEKRKTKSSISGADIKYSDFFKDPNEEGEGEDDEEEFPIDYEEDDYQDDEENLDDEDDEEGEQEDEEENKQVIEDDEEILPPEELSSFQKRATRIQEKIAQLEAENLKKKEWTMVGETGSKARPIDSLLGEQLDYEHTQRVAPVVTQETNLTLEDKIKKRILEKNYDDVIRKTENEFKANYKKNIEISDKKNTEGLGAVYEKDYMKNVMGQVEATSELKKKHKDLLYLVNKFTYKLDSLSNFQFTPKRIKDKELSITTASTITMEEKIPVAASNSTLIAPEEVYFKKHADEAGKSELSKEERKRNRKDIKKKWAHDKEDQEVKDKQREKVDKSFAKKQETSRAFKTLKDSRNTTIATTSDKTPTSKEFRSVTVFKKLQDEQEINHKRKLSNETNHDHTQKKTKFSSSNNNIQKDSSKFKL